MMATLDRAQSVTMQPDGGDRVSGPEFKQRRENVGATQAQIATFAQVGTKTLDNYEAGRTQPTVDVYWRLIDTLETLERGGEVVARMRRHPTRGGVIVARQLTDPDAASEALDDIQRHHEE